MVRKKEKYHPDYVIPAKELPSTLPLKDWRNSFHWRVLRILAEFVEGFQFLADFTKTVTIFGSARTQRQTKWYKEARKLARMLAESGFSIVTGGGPGIMEAANLGATEGRGNSIGLNIKLPYEQRINKYINKGTGFHYFFTRKVMLAYSAQAYVFFPGGYGTLDELFELITLIQTHKIYEKIPIIMVGKDFWEGLDSWLKSIVFKKYRTIDYEDLKIYHLVNNAQEAFKIIKKSKSREKIRF